MPHKKGGKKRKGIKARSWAKCLVNVAPNCKRWSNKNTMKESDCCNRCHQSKNDKAMTGFGYIEP